MQESHLISDAAKRMSDAVNLASMAGSEGKWMSFRLQTGTTDHALYDSRVDAASHMSFPEHFCYLKVPPGGMQPRECQAYLDYFRGIYEMGGRFDRDPAFNMPLMPLTKADAIRQMNVLIKGR